MKLNNKQIRYLKGQAHSKKPIVTIGMKGITDNILEEIDSALRYHELIKVKLPAGPKDAKIDIAEQISKPNKASKVGLTGRTLILFRQNAPDNTKIVLPS
jgi:RNA-binding protein